MSLKPRFVRAGIPVLCLLASLLAFLPAASAQDFTIEAAPLNPDAVAPLGVSSSNITIGAVNGFTGTVALSCQVTSTVSPLTDPPVCTVSPQTVTAPAGASATITTSIDTTTVSYSITITGTGPTTTHTTAPLNLTVLAVAPNFTVTVLTAVQPSSVPAGSGGQGTVTINPINGYQNSAVYLSCASITPLVTIPPVCSFSPPSWQIKGTPESSTLTITTFGPVVTGREAAPRSFYALWLPLPMLALAGLGVVTGGRRSRKAWGLFALFVVSGALLLMPACGNTNVTTTTPNGTTPANTYTFVLMGVDSNGNVSSNSGSTSTNPTVTLSVTKPAN